ncbi:hypothetical protein [Actinophytocola sp.]|uniref:hypothetical protein n=1 Tax=Actinophytocola sp. TaxID=1872138 RepID=UPI002D804250|nr:hypothetical protein [Actinophytocola sp.]HET9141248.1 hypothetical protein [Actinophytocola sp.]HEU5108238.1 hypothetical protein [Micromonosporaceae bacterium]
MLANEESARTAVLPTGDRVTVLGGARPAVSVRPAAGRERVMFHRYRAGDRLYVVPEDAVRRIGTEGGRRAFDVSRLLEPNRAASRPGSEPRAAAGDVELTINLRDLTGALTGDYAVAIIGLDDGEIRTPYDADGSLTVRLPMGRYFIDSVVHTTSPDGTRNTHVLPSPNTVLDRDTTIDVPAGAARPVRVTPPDPSAGLLLGEIGFSMVTAQSLADVSHLTTDLGTVSIAQLGPALPADVLTTMVNTQWATPGGEFYGLAWFPKGTVPAGFTKRVQRNEVATVRVDLGAQVPGDIGLRFAVPDSVSADLIAASAQIDLPLPSIRTEYYNSDGAEWNIVLFELEPSGSFPERASIQGGQHVFRPGHFYQLPINHAPFGPAFPAEQVSWICRCGDTIDFFLPLLGDSGGNAGISLVDSLDIKLFRDGQLVGQVQGEFAAAFPVPPEPAGYRLTAEASRPALFDTSTRVSAEWTFRSGQVAGQVTLPLSTIRFTPALDQTNTAPAGRPFLVPVAVQPQTSNELVRPVRLSVEASYDEGRTWRQTTVIANRAVLLHHPPGATSVSLRGTATDRDGNTVTETLIRAYKLANR